MKTRFALLAIVLVAFCSRSYGQACAVDKGASFITGMASFMSQGGDLFQDNESNRATTLTLSTSVNHFVSNNFFIGGGFEISTQAQDYVKTNSLGIGPQIGYAFGKPGSPVYPYLDAGLRYYRMAVDYGPYGNTKAGGLDIFVSAGLLVPIRTNLGIAIEGAYHMMDLKYQDFHDSQSGNIFSFGIGIVGLLF